VRNVELTCRLCGSRWNVARALIEWREPVTTSGTNIDGTTWARTELWTWGPRCRDVDACRKRVELAGVEWLLT
jgi:hypothetical protein